MAIGVVNFPQIDVPEVKSPWENALHSALSTYGNLQDIQSKDYQNMINAAKAKYAEPTEQANLAQAQALPAKTAAETAYQNALAKGVPSEIALRQAQAVQAQEDAEKTRRGLPFIAPQAQADIEEKKAQANFYNMGGGSSGVGNKADMQFSHNVAMDNPQLKGDPDKIYEATNVLKAGGDTLSDGTKLNPLSENARDSLDRVKKAGSTAQLINQNVQANQASAEMVPINQAIKEGVYDTGYGTTVLGISPKQIKDAADFGNHEAQKRVGDYLAAQVLLYDKAALMLKINGLPAGQRIATKISDLSAQTIKAQFPLMSAEARQIAADKVGKVLEQVLEARNKYGVSISRGLQSGQNQQNNADPFGIL